MHPLFVSFTALLALASVHAVPAGQPSAVPSSCTYTCPQQDGGAFPLGTYSDDGTTLFCSFPVTPTGDPNAYYCKYSHTNGVMTQDNDIGLCPSNAVSGTACNPNISRRSALPAPPMAAPVARAPVLNEMKVRAQLKRQRVEVEA